MVGARGVWECRRGRVGVRVFKAGGYGSAGGTRQFFGRHKVGFRFVSVGRGNVDGNRFGSITRIGNKLRGVVG